MLQILKKDNTLESWNEQKIVNAVNKAASRVMINLTDEDYESICEQVEQLIDELQILHEECDNCEFFGDDVTKVLVKVDGLSGEQLSKILFKNYEIEDEKTNEKSTLLLCGIGTDKQKIKKLKNALKKL